MGEAIRYSGVASSESVKLMPFSVVWQHNPSKLKKSMKRIVVAWKLTEIIHEKAHNVDDKIFSPRFSIDARMTVFAQRRVVAADVIH